MMAVDSLWKKVIEEIEESDSGKSQYLTLLSSLEPVTIEGQELVLEALNNFCETIVNRQFADKINHVLDREVPSLRYKIVIKKKEPANKPKPKQKVFPTMTEIVEEPEKQAVELPKLPKGSKYDGMFNSKYVFDSFVVGKSNQFAHAVCQAVSKNLGTLHNPVFIYGGVGLGKTHLIQAIGQDLLKNSNKAKIAYVSSETFTNEFIESIKDKKTDAFREKYRKMDLLLIDDVQFFKGKEQTQEEFFHTFNELFQKKKQIVLTSDTDLKNIQGLENRLVSRFGMGVVVDIQAPDLEMRAAILKKCADQAMISVSDDVIMYLAQGVSSSIRDLEGAFNSVSTYAGIVNKPISKDLIDQVLKDIIRENASGNISISYIQKRVSEFYNITVDEIVGKRRSQNLVLPRQIAMKLSQLFTDTSLNQIGEKFGGRDHTTVMHSCDKINKLLKSNAPFADEFERVKRFVTQQ
jgi:chromosomal replication initiator protein